MIDTVRPQVDQFANAPYLVGLGSPLISLFAYGFIRSTRWIRELRRDVRRGLALGGRHWAGLAATPPRSSVGRSTGPAMATPEPSTYAMMLIGFVGLGYAGLRKARATLDPGAKRKLVKRSGFERPFQEARQSRLGRAS